MGKGYCIFVTIFMSLTESLAFFPFAIHSHIFESYFLIVVASNPHRVELRKYSRNVDHTVITAVAKFFADLMLLVSWVRKRCVVHSYDLRHCICKCCMMVHFSYYYADGYSTEWNGIQVCLDFFMEFMN